MVWSADGKSLIASSTRYGGKDYRWQGDVKIWDVALGKARATLPGSFGRVLAVAPSPDGKTLAAASADIPSEAARCAAASSSSTLPAAGCCASSPRS